MRLLNWYFLSSSSDPNVVTPSVRSVSHSAAKNDVQLLLNSSRAEAVGSVPSKPGGIVSSSRPGYVTSANPSVSKDTCRCVGRANSCASKNFSRSCTCLALSCHESSAFCDQRTASCFHEVSVSISSCTTGTLVIALTQS